MTDIVERLRKTASRGVSVWGDLQMEAADEIDALRKTNASQSVHIISQSDRIKVLEEVMSLAYGHLWSINTEPGTPSTIYRPEAASYVARKILQGMLTTEQRGNGITALRAALAQPAPEPVHQFRKPYCAEWHDGLPDQYDGHGPYEERTLYAAPQAQPAPEPVAYAQNPKEGFWCWCNADEQGAIPLYAAPPTPATFAQGYAEGFNDACKPAPAVREPVIDEMDAVASKYAHKLALDLECVLSDYNGRWWDTAMNTVGEYRMAMNAIHERESPTHMGEPAIAARKDAR